MIEVKFSVITVVYNGDNCIEKTMLNIINQTYKNIEFIIIDGASNDNTLEIVKKYRQDINVLVVEKDKGIYDAMNKGLTLSTGEYVLFMNCDDVLNTEQALENIAKKITSNKFPDFVYGDSFEEASDTDQLYSKSARNHKFLWYGMFAHHQAMIYKMSLVKEHNLFYDLKYKIGADYAFTAKFLTYAKNILQLDFAVCIFKQDGASASNYKIGLKEQWDIRKNILHSNYFMMIGLYIFHYSLIALRKKIPYIYNSIRVKKTK
jgi:putative colanic acid biosynthesis glycosyltransferase